MTHLYPDLYTWNEQLYLVVPHLSVTKINQMQNILTFSLGVVSERSMLQDLISECEEINVWISITILAIPNRQTKRR